MNAGSLQLFRQPNGPDALIRLPVSPARLQLNVRGVGRRPCQLGYL
jgi:hypothetical protein